MGGILAIGRELDQPASDGDTDVAAGGVLSWVSKVAPAAQGGYAYTSRPATGKLQSVYQDAQEAIAKEPLEIIPAVVAMLRGMIVVAKPVDWEVDGMKSEGGGV